MAETQTQPALLATAAMAIPPSSIALPANSAARLRNQITLDTFSSPVNQNGSFEFDRVLKSGYVQRRTKTKVGLQLVPRFEKPWRPVAKLPQAWKRIYLVLRPNTLSVYKSDKEDKLRHQVYLSELTAVAFLKDPKQKRKNVFGLFSPSRNFHFQADSTQEAQDWVNLIRRDARIEEEEEEMFLASPIIRRQSYGMGGFLPSVPDPGRVLPASDRIASSSPEPLEAPVAQFTPPTRQTPQMFESSGVSGNELASHSDFSDSDAQRLHGASIENLAVQAPPVSLSPDRPDLGARNASQISGIGVEHDPDRVIWQGRLWFLRSKGGVKQWKNSWAVLRPRNLILYKDQSEYAAQFIVQMSSIVNVVDLDPISRTKKFCLQIITEEKSYRLAAHDEESLVQCLGAFKSLLAKRRELEARAAAASTGVPLAAS